MEFRVLKTDEYIKTCAVCGKEFHASNKRKMYCCENCKATAYRNKHKIKHEKVCPICGKEFIARRSIDVYCSRDCYEKSKINYRKEHRIIKERQEKVCPVCGKKFIGKNSRRTYCSKRCQWKAYRSEHLEELLEKSRVRYHENKEYHREWEETNREKRLIQKRKYYAEHKEEKKEYVRVNKEKIKANKRNLHHKNKQKPIYRLIRKCRDFVHRCLKNKKIHRTHTILGYTPEDLRKHLESLFYGGMNWETQNWEIHHIKPLDTFNFLNEDGTDNYNIIKEANELSNLIPLFTEDHKKLTNLYISEKRWLSLEEIQRVIVGKE